MEGNLQCGATEEEGDQRARSKEKGKNDGRISEGQGYSPRLMDHVLIVAVSLAQIESEIYIYGVPYVF